MTEWKTHIDNAIAQYGIIFADKFSDRRMPCTFDEKILLCHGIDIMELCVYCMIAEETFQNDLHWDFQEKDNRYHCIPIIIALLRKDEPYISITEPTLAMEFSQKIQTCQ